MSIGGKVLQNSVTTQPETNLTVRMLWCVDTNKTEVAVYADVDEAKPVEAGDGIWWQSGKIYWSKPESDVEVTLSKIGCSFDPLLGSDK